MSKRIPSVFFIVLLLLGMQACTKGKNLAQTEQEDLPILDSLERYSFTPSFLEANCRNPLTNTTYLKAIDFLNQESSEIARLELAIKVIEVNCLSSNQISGILDMFTFESNKLRISKTAYASCSDLANYFVVVNQLKLDKNKDDLRMYIEAF